MDCVFNFLNSHYQPGRPVLLAFSGGPDSLALLHILLEYRHHAPLETRVLELGLAHVDHGWREESAEEARIIAEMAERLDLRLHQKRLEPETMEGNLEAACREERLSFFASLCNEFGYQAVMMAHHADDLAETVLKRALEGASLPYLGGLRPVTEVNGVQVWRPMLSVSKHQIISWLNVRDLTGFHDRTNLDPRFLRGRFRSRILPELSKEFGKEVSRSLSRLGKESWELRNYLDERIDPYVQRIKRNKIGSLLDLSNDFPNSTVELKHLIRRFCESESCLLSREGLETAKELLLGGIANKRVAIGNRFLEIDRGCLCIYNPKEMVVTDGFLVIDREGKHTFGPWTVSISQGLKERGESSSNWKSLWQGKVEALLPHGIYQLAAPQGHKTYPRNQPISKWWTDHKTPAFLRSFVPLIYQDGKIIHEFLTGKCLAKAGDDRGGWLKILIWCDD